MCRGRIGQHRSESPDRQRQDRQQQPRQEQQQQSIVYESGRGKEQERGSSRYD